MDLTKKLWARLFNHTDDKQPPQDKQSKGAEKMSFKISRQAYVEMMGPTIGDRIRLGDTELFIEIENDYTTYGEEVKFGGGKVIRDGMGQSQRMSLISRNWPN